MSSAPLENKLHCTALITGGASGLGLASAEVLLSHGVSRVVLVDRDEEGARVAAKQLGDRLTAAGISGAIVEGHGCDVTNEEQVQAVVDIACSKSCSPLRLVVNSAGIGYASRVILKNGTMPTSSFSKVLEINTIGTFNVTKLAAQGMCKHSPLTAAGERGVVVNVASIAAFDGQIGQVPYSASKGAVVGMTLPLAREFARHQVRVMCIAPGVIDTPMMANASEKVRESLVADIAFPHRLGQPSEFGSLVLHIFQNSYLNGETIRLDGGLRMPPQARL